MQDIDKRLIEIRQDSKMTQEEMGKLLKVSKQTYQTIEKGQRKLHIEEIGIYKYQFDINPNWLLFGEGSKKNSDNSSEEKLINLILDFRSYGGEADLVRTEIVKMILFKDFFPQFYKNIFPSSLKSYGNRTIYALLRMLRKSEFKGLQKDAKHYLYDLVEEYKHDKFFLLGIKQEIYIIIEKLDSRDCYYLLINKEVAMKILLSKISYLDRKVGGFFSKQDYELQQYIEKL